MKGKGCLKMVAIAAGLIGVLGVCFRIIVPPDPHVNCHAILDVVLEQWLEHSQTNAFPNIDGKERESFAVINKCYSAHWN